MEYREWTITPETFTEISYPLPNSNSLLKQLGHGTRRKSKGYLISHPEHYPSGKVVSTIREGKAYIDEYMGAE